MSSFQRFALVSRVAIVEGINDMSLRLIVFLGLAHVADDSPSALDDVILECSLERSLLVGILLPAQVLGGFCHLNTNYNPGSTKSLKTRK